MISEFKICISNELPGFTYGVSYGYKQHRINGSFLTHNDFNNPRSIDVKQLIIKLT